VTPCLFVSDLHGRPDRYEKLWRATATERPTAVFLGGDLLGAPFGGSDGAREDGGGYTIDDLAGGLGALRRELGRDYPRVFLILGNDDPRSEEPALVDLGRAGLIDYAHGRRLGLEAFTVYGYACVPPTPFALKDWERYDVSRFVDPGCVGPEEGRRSVPVAEHEPRLGTIRGDLERLAGAHDLEHAVFLFHAPPYRTCLDRARLDGRSVDHVPLDLHVGSIAIRRFIEARQPWITLHGHVHESARLTGAWSERIGRTWLFGAAHDGPELCLVRLDLEHPEATTRTLA
jgi:Icc-related predicted phosphoesterase